MSETTFGTTTYDLGPWESSGHFETPPPHYTGSDPRHANELGVIWADKRQTIPLGVEDYDGCRAPILPARLMHPTPGFPGFDHVAGTEPEACFQCRFKE